MENDHKNIENEDEIDVRKIYLRNFKTHAPRVGKEYQAVIPECVSHPKPKESPKIENEQPIDNNKQNVNITEEEKIKNEIIGRKTYEKKKKKDKNEEYIPSKKKKINENES